MLAMKYILKSQRLLNQVYFNDNEWFEQGYHDINSFFPQFQENNYVPPVNQDKETAKPIVFKRGLKQDPVTGELYFDFLD